MLMLMPETSRIIIRSHCALIMTLCCAGQLRIPGSLIRLDCVIRQLLEILVSIMVQDHMLQDHMLQDQNGPGPLII